MDMVLLLTVATEFDTDTCTLPYKALIRSAEREQNALQRYVQTQVLAMLFVGRADPAQVWSGVQPIRPSIYSTKLDSLAWHPTQLLICQT